MSGLCGVGRLIHDKLVGSRSPCQVVGGVGSRMKGVGQEWVLKFLPGTEVALVFLPGSCS